MVEYCLYQILRRTPTLQTSDEYQSKPRRACFRLLLLVLNLSPSFMREILHSLRRQQQGIRRSNLSLEWAFQFREATARKNSVALRYGEG
jgi:hypothetical protein